jgi:signal transduction histidine kinase
MTLVSWIGARTGAMSAWLAFFACCGVAALAWLGYRVADEWQRSSTRLVERRTNEIADLVTLALTRDMRAVQTSVLDGRDWDRAALGPPYAVNDTVAGAFARYPYPEAFFAWDGSAGAPVFFARSERRPTWLPSRVHQDFYPVEVEPSPPSADALFARIRRDTLERNLYSTFDITIGGRAYQAVARILYSDVARERPEGVLGFLVDLGWVRDHYFGAITDQVTRIAQAGDGIACSILDERSNSVVGTNPRAGDRPAHRAFSLIFFDPIIAAAGGPGDLVRRDWTVNVVSASDPTLTIAAKGARRTVVVMGAGAVAVALGLVVAVSASRAAADTAAMRADFVSTVTHGLKTPVSVIRGIGETLIRGRVNSPKTLHEYAQLLVQESHRLTRLIDNLLAYAKVTDAADVYAFDELDATEVVHEVIKGFQRLLSEGGYTIDVEMSESVPTIRADRTALVLALDNLVDTAMRYGGESKSLTIQVRTGVGAVDFTVIDRGPGIAPQDLARVQRRFARGRSTTGHGSGLGLAIVSRIAKDHKGQFKIESTVNTGTTATLSIPIAVSKPA